jgi:hypothetical protein
VFNKLKITKVHPGLVSLSSRCDPVWEFFWWNWLNQDALIIQCWWELIPVMWCKHVGVCYAEALVSGEEFVCSNIMD